MSHIVIGLVTIVATIVANSFFEWFIHGPMMHGKFATAYLLRTHHEHHDDYPSGSYQNQLHGKTVHLPLWGGIATVGLMIAVSLIPTVLFGKVEIVVWVAEVSAYYFVGYNYVHTLFHVPRGSWFEKTKLYRYLDRRHRVHHAIEDKNWGKMTNICLVCPVADWFLGSEFQLRSQNSETAS